MKLIWNKLKWGTFLSASSYNILSFIWSPLLRRKIPDFTHCYNNMFKKCSNLRVSPVSFQFSVSPQNKHSFAVHWKRQREAVSRLQHLLGPCTWAYTTCDLYSPEPFFLLSHISWGKREWVMTWFTGTILWRCIYW